MEYEINERFLIHQSSFQIMEESCKYFDSTYEGRKESLDNKSRIQARILYG